MVLTPMLPFLVLSEPPLGYKWGHWLLELLTSLSTGRLFGAGVATEAAGLRWLQSLHALTEWNNAAVWAHTQRVLHPWQKQLSFSYKVNDLDIWCLIGVGSRQGRFYRAGLLKWWLKSCGIYLVVTVPRNAEVIIYILPQLGKQQADCLY